METFFNVYPVGTIFKKDGAAWIEIDPRYAEAMLGMESFSHLQVFYWFHDNDTPGQRAILRIHPRKNPANPLTGVFATHAPVRPNPIALSVCRCLGIRGTRIDLADIDARDGTPVIDIKGYFPDDLRPEDIRTPDWARP